MFYRFDELKPEELQADRYDRAIAIAAGLADCEIRSIERRVVRLFLPSMGDVVEGDVSRNGFTVYLGGFDWVTFAAPPHVISRFPDFQPLAQQSSLEEGAEGLLEPGDVAIRAEEIPPGQAEPEPGDDED